MNKGDQAGFTLLEVLVALVVFGFLMAGLSQGMQFGISAWRQQSRSLAARGDLDSADRTLRALIARMDPGGVGGQPPAFKGTSNSLAFTTTLPQAADALATPEADVRLAVNGHQLQLLWLAHYRNRIRPAPAPESIMLLQDVDRLEIEYWRDPKSGWQHEWAGSPLPKLLRLRISFIGDSRRRGLEIVVMPMRDRWRL